MDQPSQFGKDVEMRLVETTEDPHVAGWSITTHQQTIDGIPIVGAVLKVYDEPSGTILWKSGQGTSSDPEINTIVDGIAIAYASYLTTACKQLMSTDNSITASTCNSLAAVISATELNSTMPCFSAKPAFLIDEMSFPYTPRVFVKGALNSRITIFVGGNFTGATLRWSGGSTGACDMSTVRTQHFDGAANASNPIWVYQVKCPVPPSLNTEENVTISLASIDTPATTTFPVFWAAVPVLDKAVIVPDVGIDIYSKDFLPQSAQYLCDPDNGLVVCLSVYMCPHKSSDPDSSDSCYILSQSAFRESVEGVLRAEFQLEDFKRGKYFVYVSQHGRRPVSNAAIITVKNALATLQICVDMVDVHVVVTEAVFGSVDDHTDSSGCVTFELEQGIEYNVTAVKDHFSEALMDATPEFGKDVEMRLVETTEDPHVAGWSITTHQQTIVGAVLKVQCPR
eukprot:m51a1_g11363 hypothetical protein (453) ;mRNA; r:696-6578